MDKTRHSFYYSYEFKVLTGGTPETAVEAIKTTTTSPAATTTTEIPIPEGDFCDYIYNPYHILPIFIQLNCSISGYDGIWRRKWRRMEGGGGGDLPN